MHKYLSLIVSTVLVCCFAFSAFAWGAPSAVGSNGSSDEIMFCAVCSDIDDVKAAVKAGADFVSISGDVDLKAVYTEIGADASIIIDADSIEQANEEYNKVLELKEVGNTYFRVNAKPKDIKKWSEKKIDKPHIIVYYKGNIYFSAVNSIRKSVGIQNTKTVQFQTGNPYGVVLHNTVTKYFAKSKVRGMFSTADLTRSAKRSDTAQSWDDLISRGYQIIETAYPEDFAEYLKLNNSARDELTASVKAANSTVTKGCPSNRVSDYNKALAAANALLNDDSSSVNDMANARVKLDLAVKNISVSDGNHIKGDFALTPGRIAAAVFGIGLVVLMQVWFRSRWGKKGKAKKAK